MNDEARNYLYFWLGVACLVASLAVLFFQRQIGAVLGMGVMALWLVLGALGIYLMGKARDDGEP